MKRREWLSQREIASIRAEAENNNGWQHDRWELTMWTDKGHISFFIEDVIPNEAFRAKLYKYLDRFAKKWLDEESA